MSDAIKNTANIAQRRLTSIIGSLIPSGGVKFPAFDEAPKVDGQPQGCLWGFFDKDGKKDEIGTLNLLTSDVVRQASKEISTGEHVQLDWPLHNVEFPGFGRKEFEQKVVDLAPLGFAALDDEVYINTQSGSQWDSLKHVWKARPGESKDRPNGWQFAHQKTRMYYNGLTHDEATKSTTNGIHNWCERGGIVGRGILCDWVRWYEHKHGKPPSPVSRHEIPVSELDETLRYQGVTPRQGDVLLIRSGYVRWHDNASGEERKAGTRDNSVAIGVENNETAVRWLYDHHFAAAGRSNPPSIALIVTGSPIYLHVILTEIFVAVGDTVAFEAWPPPLESGWCLHEWLLVQWGTPIGEMWDLEKLSKTCEANGRWSFFLTSAPLHVKGGVGSPPGAIAIF